MVARLRAAWNAIFAPKGTPADVVAKLNAAVVKALDDEGVRKRLLNLGSVIPAATDRTPGCAGNPGEERDREVDAGAQAGELIHTIKMMDKGRDAGSAPCRLRKGGSFFRV